MKIAQISPLMESVPPRLYGGSERIVSYLTDELVRQGHDVTLFASGDSVSSANLVRCVPMALRLDANVKDPIPYYMLMLDRVREMADEFDILHFHIDQFHFPLFRPIAKPHRHDAARPPGPARPQAALCRLQRHAAGLDLQFTAQADRERQFRRDRLPWPSGSDAEAELQAERRLCRLSRAHLPGEAAGPGDPDRPGARVADQDRGQDRQGRRGLFPRTHRFAVQPARRRIYRRDRRALQERIPRRGAARCCFRSIGRSRSACP